MATVPLDPSPLSNLRLRWAASPLPRALRQWGEGLLALLPPAWQQRCFPPVRRLWLGVSDTGLRLEEEAGAQRQTLGTLPLDDATSAELLASLRRRGGEVDGELWLSLPARSALCRNLVLPLAAEARLEAVLQHEIERQTPFNAEQVVMAGQVLRRDPSAGQIEVELAVLPRARLEAALAVLGPLAGQLSGLDIDDAAHRAGRRRNLLPLHLRRARSQHDARVRTVVLVVTACALLATGLLSLNNREQALAALEAQRDAAFEQARAARALRAELDASTAASRFLEAQRQQRPATLTVLEDLSRRLPDDVFLTRLSIERDRVTLSGLARASGEVIPLLQASPLLRAPALAGMVQKDPTSGRDSFTVVAQLAPGVADEPR
ncbi:PilN domain-containing protein [Silanimonas sp.]|uniref:PilN domain-containing protein n=1 Tax=Silanimonas sp. TaxID=1929290 RepID=UPI001BBC3B62|nr:PilN domain-containing protein [Silanimonas sp.]MBS3896179.1 PilN domain-containing protein [Silanimonas sp.]MBS3924064.1 PilN domain-containing protein [Xanthomonadaceae bacterium]